VPWIDILDSTSIAAVRYDARRELLDIRFTSDRRRGFELGDAFCAYNLHLLLAREGREQEANNWLRAGAARGDEKAIARLEYLRLD